MPSNNLSIRYQPLLTKIGGSVVALLIFSIPLSTALVTILSSLLFLLWLLSAHFLKTSTILKKNPIALFATLLFLYLLLATTYSSANLTNALSSLSRYRELLLLIILPPFWDSEKAQRWAWHAFFAGSLVTLLGSYAIHFGIIDYLQATDPTIKSRITHSLLVAFFAFYCAHKASQKGQYQYFYLALLLLCAHNLFFIVSGRTGQLIFSLIMVLFYFQRFPKKHAFIAAIVTILILVFFVKFSENAERINQGFLETESYLHSDKAETNTSMGLRLAFWKHSLTMIAEHPLFGSGTGSFPIEYLKVITKNEIPSNNPHNEYLLITVQAGITGLLLFLAFLFNQFRYSLKLDDEHKYLAQGLLLSLIINSIFNSSILDMTEGYWFTSMIALCFVGLTCHSAQQTES